ncbi:hypothetical protein, partial [Helicobacter typhlonius]|uniref:hypothetical protein n=1 Tax=Helicobacter typhlonius TaxID=76936 RepID=UPI002FE2CF78
YYIETKKIKLGYMPRNPIIIPKRPVNVNKIEKIPQIKDNLSYNSNVLESNFTFFFFKSFLLRILSTTLY